MHCKIDRRNTNREIAWWRSLGNSVRCLSYLWHLPCLGSQLPEQQSPALAHELPWGRHAATLVRGAIVIFGLVALTLAVRNDCGATAPSANRLPVLWLKNAKTLKAKVMDRESRGSNFVTFMARLLKKRGVMTGLRVSLGALSAPA
jgi:hypothetical protein